MKIYHTCSITNPDKHLQAVNESYLVITYISMYSTAQTLFFLYTSTNVHPVHQWFYCATLFIKFEKQQQQEHGISI